MNVLQIIYAKKAERLSEAKFKTSISEMKSMARDAEKPRDFKSAINRKGGHIRLIAEIKKASPSKGLIRADFDPVAIARIYGEKADAISVLTEADFFNGDLDYIRAVKAVQTKPVIRKDFLFDPFQIYESLAFGSDAILLIASLLVKSQAEDLLQLGRSLGMSVLFEIRNRKELEVAVEIGAEIIGINNRSLKSLDIDLATTFDILPHIPKDRIVVGESGIETKEDVLKFESAGVSALLVGTAFMKSPVMADKIKELFGR